MRNNKNKWHIDIDNLLKGYIKDNNPIVSNLKTIDENNLSPCNQNFSIDEQIEYLNNINKDKVIFPPEKIIAIKNTLLSNQHYPNIHSHYQFQTIINSFKYDHNLKDFDRLITLIWDKMKIKNFFKLYRILMEKERSDIEYYALIRDLASQQHKKVKNPPIIDISQFIYYKMNNLSNKYNIKDLKNIKYLDVGCGDGWKTTKLGKLLKLNRTNIICSDLENWFHYSSEKKQNNKNMTNLVIEPEKDLDLNKNSVNLVTMMHALHHMDDYDFRFKNLYDIMKKNSVFWVIEHDLMTVNDCCLTDIEHGLYELSLKRNLNFYKDHKSNYFNWIETCLLAIKNGFTFIDKLHFTKGNIQKNYLPTRTCAYIFTKK